LLLLQRHSGFISLPPRGEEHSEETSKHDICPCPDEFHELRASQRIERKQWNNRFGTNQHRPKHYDYNHKDDQEASSPPQKERLW